MVDMLADGILESCIFSLARVSPSAFSMRSITAARSFSFICAAAFLVNVTARILSISVPLSSAATSFFIITKVLPLPAEAETITLPSASIAAVCSAVSFTCSPPSHFLLCRQSARI